jgi:hypothetical protein
MDIVLIDKKIQEMIVANNSFLESILRRTTGIPNLDYVSL